MTDKNDKTIYELKATGPLSTKDEAVFFIMDVTGTTGVIEEELGKDAVLTSYVDLKSFAVEELEEALEDFEYDFTITKTEDRDWNKEWKDSVKIVRIAGRYIIKPTWMTYKKEAGRIIIEMDPGMAFGTGTHPTTRMCLKGIYDNKKIIKKKKCLDIGTGSAILAIAMKKEGANEVLATEIDKEAIKVGKANAVRNKVDLKYTTVDIGKLKGEYDFVTANILSGVLKKNSRHIAKRLKKGGTLVLSGILGEEVQEVIEEFKNQGLKHVKTMNEKEWAAPVFTK